MLIALEEFTDEKEQIKNIKYASTNEQQMMSRLMKYELIDMADRVENMQTMMEHNQIDSNFLLQVVVNKFD